jgi:hypothetical protein
MKSSAQSSSSGESTPPLGAITKEIGEDGEPGLEPRMIPIELLPARPLVAQQSAALFAEEPLEEAALAVVDEIGLARELVFERARPDAHELADDDRSHFGRVVVQELEQMRQLLEVAHVSGSRRSGGACYSTLLPRETISRGR